MFSSVSGTITTDASGDATIYLAHRETCNPNGFVYCIKYTPGTLDTGADLTITSERFGVPILSKLNAGTSVAYFFPRVFPNSSADGAAGTVASELIPVKDDRIKVVVAQGGNVKQGTIEVILLTDL